MGANRSLHGDEALSRPAQMSCVNQQVSARWSGTGKPCPTPIWTQWSCYVERQSFFCKYLSISLVSSKNWRSLHCQGTLPKPEWTSMSACTTLSWKAFFGLKNQCRSRRQINQSPERNDIPLTLQCRRACASASARQVADLSQLIPPPASSSAVFPLDPRWPQPRS